jgi:asparagine synthase (glutamine-hydrolysing)
VTVALSGDGGDELFAGYRDYAGVYSIYNKICGIPYPVRNAAGGLMEHFPGQAERSRRIRAHGTLLRANGTADLYERTYETWPGLDELIKNPDECIREQVIHGDAFPGDPVHTAMLMNMQMYHPDDILVKVDRTAMAVSLETRVPMLDADVVEFAWSLPLEYVFDGKKGKLVLRDVLHRYVPEELTDRPKQGFGVPVARWIRDGKLRKWADDLFNPELINRHNLLSADAAIKMWRAYTDQGIWRPQIWYVLMLNAWLDAN